MKKVIIYAIGCITLLYLVEQVLELPYTIKTIIKLPLFTVYPWIKVKELSFVLQKKALIKVLVLSSLVFSFIILAYLIVVPLIDMTIIQDDFQNRIQITKAQFIIAAIYTVFVNSFIEELFFRVYIFKGLASHRKLAYIFSSGIFSLYHVTIFKSWFNLPVFLLVMLGLFVGGLIFSYFVEKTKSVIASYIIHIAADLAIVVIGINVLGFA